MNIECSHSEKAFTDSWWCWDSLHDSNVMLLLVYVILLLIAGLLALSAAYMLHLIEELEMDRRNPYDMCPGTCMHGR